MSTIKKSKLINTLKRNNMSESFIDKILGNGGNSKNKKELARLERDLEDTRNALIKTKSKMEDTYIRRYGSLEKTPPVLIKLMNRYTTME